MHMDRSLVAPPLRNSNAAFCYLLGCKFFACVCETTRHLSLACLVSPAVQKTKDSTKQQFGTFKKMEAANLRFLGKKKG